MTRAVALGAALLSALATASSAQAAAPNYILVSGPGLARPVLLANWDENAALLLAVAGAPSAKGSAVRGLARRPRLDLAEFWGWQGLPRPTRPSQANQHGWFYPAHRGRPPLIAITVNGRSVPRLVPLKVLKIFKQHGIPIRL